MILEKDKKLLGGCKLYQIPHIGFVQMMGYMLEDTHENLIVIDGGNAAEAEFLEKLILSKNKTVAAWFLTHAHDDHITAITEIINRGAVKIEKIYFQFPPDEWLLPIDPRPVRLKAILESSGISIVALKKGMQVKVGDMTVTCLNTPLKHMDKNNINVTSAVLRVDTPGQPILFLGDMEESVEDDLIFECGEMLKCPIIQMAHHGQSGLSERFYQYISPKICLFPTPDWLWDNNLNHRGLDTGHWTTLETRKWLRKLKTKNYPSKNKLVVLE